MLKRIAIIGGVFLFVLGLAAAGGWFFPVSDREIGLMLEEPEPEFPSARERMIMELADWKRPEGPVTVALQAGHWRSSEAPDELEKLRGRGARGGGKLEWEVNLEIAKKTAAILEKKGLRVEILPTTIPPKYYADVFVSIHADDSTNTRVSGYRTASARRDLTGKASMLSTLLDGKYAESTGLQHHPVVTGDMSGYYAFNWDLYVHSLHPMTPAAILETGFLTSARDRKVIVSGQDKAAKGIADAIIAFLEM